MSAQLICDDPGQWQLQGRLEFEDVEELQELFMQALNQANQNLQLSLAQLENANSVILALLVDMLRVAGEHGIKLEFTAMSETLANNAKLTGVYDVLPLS